jgi:WD40 repeat protein
MDNLQGVAAVRVLVYDAFLSYSSRSDYQAARRIESFLESFHRRVARVAGVRPLEICRDGSDFRLPRNRTGDVHGDDAILQILGQELAKSRTLLVLCSPDAVRSHYVNQEISLWLEKFSDRPILPLILEAKAPSQEPEECFPPLLIQKQLHQAAIWYDLRAMRSAPLWERMRSSGFRNAEDELVRLAGDLLEWDASSAGALATVWEREQLRRRRRTAGIVTVIACLVVVLAVFAIHSATRAAQQQKAARANAIAMAADSSPDPLLGSLLLAELEDLPQPVDAMRVARKIAELAVPYTVVQTSHPVIKALLSPDGNRVLAASNDGRATLFRVDGTGDPMVFYSEAGNRPLSLCGAPQVPYAGPVALTDIVFSSDGSHFATSSLDGTVRLWSPDHRDPVMSQFLDAPVQEVGFSPDNQWLFTSVTPGAFYAMSVDGKNCYSATLPGGRRTMKVRFPSKDAKGLIVAMDNSIWNFSLNDGISLERVSTPRVPDDISGQTVAISDNYEKILLADAFSVVWFSLKSAKSFRKEFSPASPNTAGFSSDGKLVGIATSDGKIHIFDASSGIETTAPLNASVQFLVSELEDTARKAEDTVWQTSSIGFNGHDSELVATSTSGTTRIWDLKTRSVIRELRASGAESAEFNDEENRLVTYGIDGSVKVWRLDDQAEPQVFQHTSRVEHADFMYDGSLVVTLTQDGKAHLWSRKSGNEIPLDSDQHSETKMVRVSNNAIFVVHEDQIESRKLIRAEQASRAESFSDGSLSPIVGAEVSANAERLVAWSSNGNIVVWRLSDPGRPERGNLGQQLVSALRWNSDLTKAMSLSPLRKLRVWDLKDLSHPQLALEREEQQLQDFKLSRSGMSAILTIKPADSTGRQAKGMCKLLRLEGDRKTVDLEFDSPEDWLDDCFLDPAERRILLTSGQGRVFVLDTRGASERRELRDAGGFAHQGMMEAATFNQNGTQVITFGAVDAEIKIWSLPNGSVDTLVGHEAAITDGTLSPEESYILSASEDKSARVWRVQWPEILRYLRARTSANLTVQQRIRYLGETEDIAASTRVHQELKFHRGTNSQSNIPSPTMQPQREGSANGGKTP